MQSEKISAVLAPNFYLIEKFVSRFGINISELILEVSFTLQCPRWLTNIVNEQQK